MSDLVHAGIKFRISEGLVDANDRFFVRLEGNLLQEGIDVGAMKDGVIRHVVDVHLLCGSFVAKIDVA